ncbi:hypothetical protein [Sphingobacterium mizutaii]|uniref:hypothetical protein n=1 Tax=Sphingobacterium mizutaii TaxID=1010 RepID=UPI001623C8C2|nr:hypothetical protein [Sphingobacterium mizutaii]
MFDELKKYKQNDHFFFKFGDSLMQVCNAPTDKCGIYLVYALKNRKRELIYIGRSGKIGNDGTLFIRRTGLGGIKDRIVNGHQFGKIPRKTSWPKQMELENLESLDVYWFVTHCDKFLDCPRILENKLLKKYNEVYGCLPKWNNVL